MIKLEQFSTQMHVKNKYLILFFKIMFLDQ